jgi:hypothetical protein
MAKLVLGIGTSHSPMLNATPEEWSRFEAREPTMTLLDREGHPSTYEALVREAAGRFDHEYGAAQFAERHARAQTGLDRLAGEIRNARLDALVVIGDDQKELFLSDNLPAFLIYCGYGIAHRMRAPKPEWVDWFAAIQSRYYPAEGSVDHPVHSALARHMIDRLVGDGFEPSASDRLPRDEGEGHAFAFLHQRLLAGGKAVPIVPVFINTYYPPNQPTPRRCYLLGRALRTAIECFPEPLRVGVLGSGGLSHFTLDADLDREVLRALKQNDAEALINLPVNKLCSGNSEIRNWIALAGAAAHLPFAWSEYVPAYRSPAGTGTGLAFAAWRSE